ncbi:MAG TPA: LOG family protein, partial [Steroidobacteraceae bacterium]|nr:LOG family protein [Steroidobacteraceae bacterium]
MPEPPESGDASDVRPTTAERVARIMASPTYRLAEDDPGFLGSDTARPARLQLEFLRAEMHLQRHDIASTVVVFGSTRLVPESLARARLADIEATAAMGQGLEAEIAAARRTLHYSRYYEEARTLGVALTRASEASGRREFVVVTGGGPGAMEAANRGALESGGRSAGFNISLPAEQQPNPYITPDLAFRFHYFALRKMHFMLRAKAICIFPGGFGTFDELFEALTLIQTGKIAPMPVILFDSTHWKRLIDWD